MIRKPAPSQAAKTSIKRIRNFTGSTGTLLSILLSVLFLAACNQKEKRQVESEEILIGEYGSLTGLTATFGISTDNGLQLAVEKINGEGGVLGKKIKVIVEDDQGKPEEAQTAVTKLINKDRVVAVIGEVASSRSLAAAPVCQAARVPMISPSSTNPNVTLVGDYIFRTCFIDPFQGQVMAKFCSKSLKLKRVAILKDIKNDYSVGLSEFFAKSFTEMGGEIIAVESYSEGDNDFNAQLTSLKAKKPEAIFVPGYYTEVGLIARQARKLGLEVPLMGGDGWDSPKLVEIGGKAMEGCYFSNHFSAEDPSPVLQQFVADYKAKFGQVPDALAALGYEAGMLLADAIKRAGSARPDSIQAALIATRDFPGVTGVLTFDENRNPVKPAVVMQIKDGNFTFMETISP